MKTAINTKNISNSFFLLFFIISQIIFSQQEAHTTIDAVSRTISQENALLGTTEWELTNPAIYREVEGYPSKTSVALGDSIQLFTNTKAQNYTIVIYRMGWYNGLGGRQIAGPFLMNGMSQEIPKPAPETNMIECDWKDPFTLKIGQNWTTGVYLAKLEESASHKQSYILFVVRNDKKASDILFQLPVTTYQAYNAWGGKSLYNHQSGDNLPWSSSKGRASYKVSFNRPYAASTNIKAAKGMGAGEFLTNVQPKNEGYPASSAGWDYSMVRWLEKNGYDVSYVTNVDIHSSPEILKKHQIFLSQGHDEYWSKAMKDHIIAARDNGLSLAFFAANVAYWQIRFEPSPITHDANRTIVCYKDVNKDPIKGINTTVMPRNPPLSNPESSFVGVQYFSDRVDADIVISNASHPVFKDTGLKNGDKLKGVLGYEVDRVNSFSPSNIAVLSSSKAFYLDPENISFKAGVKTALIKLNFLLAIVIVVVFLLLLFFILRFFSRKKGAKTYRFTTILMAFSVVVMMAALVGLYIFQEANKSNMTIYTVDSGAKVFSTGSIQWSWGLDDYNVPDLRTSRHDESIEKITHNVLELMGAKHTATPEIK